MSRNARRLRARQPGISARASERLREATQPDEPTVEAVRDLVANAQSRRYIEIEVPRSRAPMGSRVTLLRQGGPRSAEGKAIKWDGQRRVVTAYWLVEDLRAWLESIEAGDGSAGMQIISTEIPQADMCTIIADAYGCAPAEVFITVDGDGRVKATVKAGLDGVNRVDRKLRKASGE